MNNSKCVTIKTLISKTCTYNVEKCMKELDYYCFLDKEIQNKLNKNEPIDCDTAMKILFTHHLLCIFCNKTDDEQLLKTGAYTVSKIVDDYYSGQIFDTNGNYQDNHYNVSKKLFNKFVNSHLGYYQENGTWKYYLKSDIPEKEDMKQYFISRNLIENNYVKFIPNATISDYYNLFNSFDNYKGDLFPQTLADSESLEDMARRLFIHTYSETLTETNIKDYSELLYVVKNKNDFDTNKFTLKQIWYVVRDYFYNPIFSNCLRCTIGVDRFNYQKNSANDLKLPQDFFLNA